jgi:plasmid stabilization system protein ParE
VTRSVVFRPDAEDEVRDARQWYESRRSGLGRTFAEAVDAVVERIAAKPLQFPTVHNDIRRAVLSRFPYAVYFGIADESIVVLAVHGRQDPSRWQHRR